MDKTDEKLENAEETVKEPEKETELTQEDKTALLEEKVGELEKQLADAKNDFLRAHADLENTRKRLLKDKEDAVTYANSRLIEELLTPLDNLERAVASCEGASEAKAIADGVSMVLVQFKDVLKKFGLEEIAAAPGTEFNPEEHEAMMMEVDSSLDKEEVRQEFIKGYKLHGRVLRPAKVKVAKPE